MTGTARSKIIANDPLWVLPTERLRAEWFAEMWRRVNPTGRVMHVRGLYYAVLALGNVQLPGGYGRTEPFVNSDNHWAYFQRASVAARWQGLVPFDAIADNRNGEPVVIESVPSEWSPTLERSYFIPSVELPSDWEIALLRHVTGGRVRQPFKLIIWGEKTSLDEVLAPIASRYGCDLYLGSGEASNTHLYQMARSIAADGREAVIFTFADCDPAGHSMPVSIGYKLACFQELGHVDPFNFRVIPVSLTVDQVGDLKLPSSPLKDTERRRDHWIKAFGIEQTEIDALATLRPDVLNRIARDAVGAFYDATLWGRVQEAVNEAVEALDADEDDEPDEKLQERVDAALYYIEKSIEDLEAIRDELPDDAVYQLDIEQPEPVLGPLPDGIISSSMSIAEIGAATKERKRFEE